MAKTGDPVTPRDAHTAHREERMQPELPARAAEVVAPRDAQAAGRAGRPRFEPQVERPVPRMRPAFAIALIATVAFSLGVVAWDAWLRPPSIGIAPPVLDAPRAFPAKPRAAVDGESQPAMRGQPRALPSGCTQLEVEQTIRAPSLTDVDRAVCLAVAGKIDRARAMLVAMSSAVRTEAIARVFELAHPIADRGDDASAGPIMGLVVEFWPGNYMAVFHAGMAEFALGHDDVAGPHLEHFLTMYTPRDVWRQRAEQALAAIAAHAAIDQRQAPFP